MIMQFQARRQPQYTPHDLRRVLKIVDVDTAGDWLKLHPGMLTQMASGRMSISPSVNQFIHRLLVEVPRFRVFLSNNDVSQRAIARSLGEDERTVRRWATGEQAMPDDIWSRLHEAAAVARTAREASGKGR